jgi:hypothetical protein
MTRCPHAHARGGLTSIAGTIAAARPGEADVSIGAVSSRTAGSSRSVCVRARWNRRAKIKARGDDVLGHGRTNAETLGIAPIRNH